jgi:hypothetical protein
MARILSLNAQEIMETQVNWDDRRFPRDGRRSRGWLARTIAGHVAVIPPLRQRRRSQRSLAIAIGIVIIIVLLLQTSHGQTAAMVAIAR